MRSEASISLDFPYSYKRMFASPLKPTWGFGEIILFISPRDGFPNIYGVSSDGVKTLRILDISESARVIGHLDQFSDNKMVAFTLAYGAQQ